MNRVGEFEKVSYERFCKDFQAEGFAHLNKGIDDFVPVTEEEIRVMWEVIDVPERATSGSAGYDFKAPITIDLRCWARQPAVSCTVSLPKLLE